MIHRRIISLQELQSQAHQRSLHVLDLPIASIEREFFITYSMYVTKLVDDFSMITDPGRK